MNYETLTDKQLYEFYLDATDEEQEEIEELPRFEAYVRDKDYTAWQRTQEWYRKIPDTDELMKCVRNV